MRPFVPLHVHSDFSLLDGLSKTSQIAKRCKEIDVSACALTDHGSISGIPSFIQECKKKEIKSISGCEFYISQQDSSIKTPENGKLTHLCVLAKNKEGWKNLIKASSFSFRPENFYRKPRLNLEKLSSYSQGNFIVFSGHMGSDLADICFEEPKLAYNVRTYEEARTLVHKDWKNRVQSTIEKYQKLFGKDNFFVEIQLVDHKNLPASLVVAKILRHCAKLLNVPTIATPDAHYPRKEDAVDQRVLLCSALDTTMNEVQKKIENGEDVSLSTFFRSNNYHIPSIEEMNELHGEFPQELDNTVKIAELCESYTIDGKPLLPKFTSDGKDAEYLRELAENGWTKKIEGVIPKDRHKEYRDRLEEEIKVLVDDAGLSSYFLVVQDYINYAVNKLKSKVGKGRGSAAGCLLSYLIDITRVDPIKYGLIFSRFYNSGRNAPGRIAFPDIDSDFTISSREKIIQYCREKYGKEKVCQMATFSRMQGRGALKDVLRAHERCSFDEMNKITEFIPDEAEISDQLQEMKEETGEASIILWALQNNSEQLKEWCFLKEDGELDGPLSLDFAQAIRLEGTKRNMGKHASGLIISSETLTDMVPMTYDKSTDEMIVGIDMRDAEKMGLLKFDILGLRTLDALQGAEDIIRTGGFVKR